MNVVATAILLTCAAPPAVRRERRLGRGLFAITEFGIAAFRPEYTAALSDPMIAALRPEYTAALSDLMIAARCPEYTATPSDSMPAALLQQ